MESAPSRRAAAEEFDQIEAAELYVKDSNLFNAPCSVLVKALGVASRAQRSESPMLCWVVGARLVDESTDLIAGDFELYSV